MSVGLSDISIILSLFDIHFGIDSFEFIINRINAENIKMIIKAELSGRRPLIVKLIRNDRFPRELIEEQSRFSEHLRKRGVTTPRRYKNGGAYCAEYHFNGFSLDVTIEDYLGEEIKLVDFELACKIGALMGANHRIAEENNLHLSSKTIFDVCGYNEVSGYNEFVRLGENGLIKHSSYAEILSIYETKMNRIKAVWDSLPRFATQGDYSINNLTYISGELGIFDYNLAGDETLIGDMILEGLLTANEMDLAEGLTEADRILLFRQFVDGYTSQRLLSPSEKNIFGDIYSISQAMWFTRIMYREDSLARLVEREEREKIECLLSRIYKIISGDN